MLAILLLSILPADPAVRESVDVVEINHFYDGDGKPIFDQLIFWDTEPPSIVRDWRLMKSARFLHHPPRIVLLDGDTVRVIRVGRFEESWTQEDPELVNRDVWRVEWRRKLLR